MDKDVRLGDGWMGAGRLGASARAPRRLVRRLAWAFAALLLGLAVIAAGELARRGALADLRAAAKAGLPLAASALRGELDKQRALPVILSDDPAVRAAVSGDAAGLPGLDRKLSRLAASTRAAVIYLVDRTGIAIAASNHAEPTSFVGQDYRFRRYVTGAMREGAAEQVALGTVSRRPGVYIAERVEAEDGTALGVVVVKVELDAVEADWRAGGAPVYVADPRGIVVATSVPDWRFRTLRPLEAREAAEIRDSLQFGQAPLAAMPLGRDPALDGLVADGEGRLYVEAAAPMTGGLPGWRLHRLLPADAVLASATSTARLVTALALVVALGAGLLFARRRARLGAARAREALLAAELEAKVEMRTQDLFAANRRLTAEIGEREKAEARVLSLRDDLAQANRLATLGQITAGVAHEINQPLAAIRTYAENAGLFLARRDEASAAANIATVVGLTARIAAITETLRGFARRGDAALEPVAVEDAVDGALLILGSRIRGGPARLDRHAGSPRAVVLAGRIRLEQVLVNLLRNALDALGETPGGRVSIATRDDGADVLVVVSDNGPGIADAVRATLFTPFKTTRKNGLGLGLVIAGDIVTEFGGTLTVTSRPGEGAAFTIRLKRIGEA